MNKVAEIQSIIGKHNQNNSPFWSREDGDIYHPNGHGTIDTLYTLGTLGVTKSDFSMLSKAIDFVFEYQNIDGSFKYAKASSKLPCITARILGALAQLGVNTNKRLEKSYQQLLDIQWNDGGWRCKTVKLGRSPETDASNPGTTLYVLDAFRFRNNSKIETELLHKGVDFLLNHWETRKPLGPCTFGIGSRFFKIEFPFIRYNLFYYVYVLSFYKYAKQDPRFHKAYQLISAKSENGKILPENPHRAWRNFNFAKKGEVSDSATKCWEEIESNMNYS